MRYQVDNCGYCGACVAVCTNQVLELTENEIIMHKGCDDCGNCIIVCPLGALSLEDSNEI